jgi:hypothetical protein
MALLPKISSSLSGKCNLISFTEQTNPYVLNTNTTGWGTPNIDTTDIDYAVVQFYNLEQTPAILASGDGTIVGNVFTVVTHLSGTFAVGQTLTGPGIAPGTVITAILVGTGNGNGDIYQVNIAQPISLTTINGVSLTSQYILKDVTTGQDLYANVISAPTPGSFPILTEANWSNPDGIYRLVYTIVDADGNVYTNETQHVLFLCNLCNCKDALVQKLIDACDTPTVTKLKEQVDQMEIFIYGIQSAFACADFDTADGILDAASTFCETLMGCMSCGCSGNC